MQEPNTSWGVLIEDGAAAMESNGGLCYSPAAFLALTLFALNYIADGLRDAFDPKDPLKRRPHPAATPLLEVQGLTLRFRHYRNSSKP